MSRTAGRPFPARLTPVAVVGASDPRPRHGDRRRGLGEVVHRAAPPRGAGERDYYLAWGPPETPVEELVTVPGARWRVEEAIKLAKSACGLADYEVRSFHGWYRHITLAQLAAAFLAVQDAASLRERDPSPRSTSVRRRHSPPTTQGDEADPTGSVPPLRFTASEIRPSRASEVVMASLIPEGAIRGLLSPPAKTRVATKSGRLSGHMSGSVRACFPGRSRGFGAPCRAGPQDAAGRVRRGAEPKRAACLGG